MKKYLLVGCIATLAACSNAPEKKAPAEKPMPIAQDCIYSFNNDATSYHWLAYKLTDKVGVPGVIDSAVVTGMTSAKSASEVFKNAEVTLFIPSLDSKDATRDKKIVDIFFGAISNSQSITGKIKSVEGTSKKGKGAIALNMNNVVNDIPFEYEIDDTHVKLNFVVDFNSFQAQKAIADLNKACDERHKGADGKSILWPDVKITILSTLDKDCK